MELIAETTEKLCGHKPDHQAVETFIASNIQKIVSLTIQRPPVITPIRRTEVEAEETYKNKSISSLTFKGRRYEVNSWKDMLVQICNIMLATHRDRFEQVLNLRGRKKPYFTKNPNELTRPEKISGTDIYVEVNMSANTIVRFSIDILSLFGYMKDDLSIEAR